MHRNVAMLAALAAVGFVAAASADQSDVELRTANDTERRCCSVQEKRWVREPRMLWSPLACIALGDEGEYAPQGMPGAEACAANNPDIDDPSPIPPNPGHPDDDGSDDGGRPEDHDGEIDLADAVSTLTCPDSWGQPRVWSPSDARQRAVAHVAACDRLIARALSAGDWASMEALRVSLEAWGLESIELSDPLMDAMSGGTPPSNIAEIAGQVLKDTQVLSGAQRAAAVLMNFVEAAQLAAPRTAGAVSACTGEGLWRFESDSDLAVFVRDADAAYVGTLWRTPATADSIPARLAVETWVSFTVPADPATCPAEGASDALR